MIGISNKSSRKFNSIYYTPLLYNNNKARNETFSEKSVSEKVSENLFSERVSEKKLSSGVTKFASEPNEKNGKLSIIERILQEQSKEITQLRAEIVELRDELHLSTLGSILVRFVKDSVFEENTVANISQGTQMELKSPFNENEKGLWASRQIMGITSDGMEIRADMVLIARRISEGGFEPLVEILEK